MNRRTKILIVVMLLSMVIALQWENFSSVREGVHAVLDPTAGRLLDWNINIGMIAVVFFISLSISLLQKVTVDQETLKEFKKEQKLLQEEMKKFRDHPEKMLELQKKQFEFIPKTFDITMRPFLYTAIPIVLFFRWFHDYFATLEPTKIFGLFGTNTTFIFPTWLWPYLILSIIFASIFRKALKLA